MVGLNRSTMTGAEECPSDSTQLESSVMGMYAYCWFVPKSRGKGEDQRGAIDIWGKGQYSDCPLDLTKPKCLHHAESFIPNAVSAPKRMLYVLTGAEFNCSSAVGLIKNVRIPISVVSTG